MTLPNETKTNPQPPKPKWWQKVMQAVGTAIGQWKFGGQ